MLVNSNPQARKMGGVELITNCSKPDCRFKTWWLHKHWFGRHCWRSEHVTLAFITYEERLGGTQYIPLFVDSDWGKVEAKWEEILGYARNYPYAEQLERGSLKISRFPQSVYCLGDDVNNSNTFIRWLFISAGIIFDEMTGCHPGRDRPREVPTEYFQGDVFCPSDSASTLVTGKTCSGWRPASQKFKCTRLLTCTDDF